GSGPLRGASLRARTPEWSAREPAIERPALRGARSRARAARSAAGERRRARSPRFPAGQAGAVLIAVVVLSFLLAASALGAFTVAWAWRRSAALGVARAQAAAAAAAAAGVAAQWFEEAERGSLLGPPEPGQVQRDLRRIDPDGDGRGPLWRDAEPPWNVRYQERAGALFRPGAEEAEARFVGTEDGPDVVIDRSTAPELLDRLTALVGGGGPVDVVRLALRRPPPLAAPDALATVEATAERSLPGARVLATARAELLEVDWGRLDRPLVSSGRLELRGEASWARGEAVAAGDLEAGTATAAGWPGGIPWLAPDRPLRDDSDGDGTADDADGDGTADLAAWRSQPGSVPDPWWRARIGGRWPGVDDDPGPCAQPFPFGPRRSPPAPPSKTEDRSGVFLSCPVATRPPVPEEWRELARAGVRGAWAAEEIPDRPGSFRLEGGARERSLADVWPAGGGLLLLRCTATLRLERSLGGGAGAVLADCPEVVLREEAASLRPDRAPGDPRDTRGEDRLGSAADDRLPVFPEGTGCGPWSVGPWEGPSADVLARSCPEARTGFAGILGSTGPVTLEGPLVLHGQLRGAGLVLDGSGGPVTVAAWGASREDAGWRPGPPGAPRILLAGLRLAP
ncbi:MAG: hypothetical protein D6718_06600, partial [Acidobacteria bacterium]